MSHKYALDLESKKDIEIPETKQEIQQLKDLINKGPGDWFGIILQDEDEEGSKNLRRKERLTREVAQVTSEADTYYPLFYGALSYEPLEKAFLRTSQEIRR